MHPSVIPLKQVERFKHVGVIFMSDGMQEVELRAGFAGVNAVMR